MPHAARKSSAVVLGTADALVALLHPGFHASRWTDQELGYAMGRGILVIAIKLGEDPYGFLGRFQAINGEKKPAPALAEELFNILVGHKQSCRGMAEALLARLEDSNSFAEAKRNVGLYLPSYLVLGRSVGDAFHVLFAVDLEGDNVRIVTAYRPSPDEWEDDLKTRRTAK